MKVAAVIVAGGNGTRAGGARPKQYQIIGGRPVIWWTAKVFASHPAISHVQVVIGQHQEEEFFAATAGLGLPAPVVGGDSRQTSCRIGVDACGILEPDVVLIHDAARPFVSHALIDTVLDGLHHHPAIVPALAVADTLKYAPAGLVEKTLERNALYTVQTPQGFHFSAIQNAHAQAWANLQNSLTDDAAVAELAGLKVHIVAGDAHNRKLTTQNDITMADAELTIQNLKDRPDVRVGQGIDFHVFAPGKAIWLNGIEISYVFKLKGHSDADVALHAVTDAILGAIGEGDIGIHFPPSDPQWKNAKSSIFVEKAMALLKTKAGLIANADITILAEAPKISPHIPAMKAVLSKLLCISTDRIAIKATTTETMGAIGRKEGMAAFATVTVRLPA